MGEKSKYSFSDMMFSSALIHNPVLIQAIGLGAVVAVATTLKTALLLAVAFVPVMIVTQMIACLMLKRVPRWIRVTLYLLIGVAITAPIMYLIDRVNPDIRLGAGVYLALTAASPITAMHCEKFAVKTDLKHAFYDAVAAAAGYGAVIILAGFLRELFGMSCIWGKHVNLPFTFPSLLMPFGGFILLAFCAAGLKALINRRFPEYSQETELEIKKTSVIVSKKNLGGETAVQTAQEPEQEKEPEDNNTEQIEAEPEENDEPKKDDEPEQSSEERIELAYIEDDGGEIELMEPLEPDDGVEYNIEDVIKAFTNREFPESENVDDEKFGSTLNHLFGLAELENESDREESEEDGEGEK